MSKESLYQQKIKTLKHYGVSAADIDTAKEAFAKHQFRARTQNGRKEIVLSTNPHRSAVKPLLITVQDIDELKSLAGVSNERFKQHFKRFHNAPVVATRMLLATENSRDPEICKAMQNYIFGDSADVVDYREALNRLKFPYEVAVFSGEDLVVESGETYIIEDDSKEGEKSVNLTFNSVTIKSGGRIEWRTSGTMNATTMETEGGSETISIGGNGGNGAAGANGANGSDGSKGSNAVDHGKDGCTSAGTGSTGSAGSPGNSGGNAGPGEAAEPVSIDVETLNGNQFVQSTGGNGGHAGNGGNGGNGGKGGAGGSSDGSCGSGKGGNGGAGGDGGSGGSGGKGGDGNTIYIYYQNGSPTLTTKAEGGTGGNSGSGGAGGAGGSGGTGSTNGTTGSHGDNAANGTAGSGGKPGKVFINGEELG